MKSQTTSGNRTRTGRGNGRNAPAAQSRVGHDEEVIQQFGTVKRMPIGLGEQACRAVVELLNPLLADTMTIRDLYKKHHWQVSGPNFYQLHLLYDKHFAEQQAIVDQLAERIQTLGGISVAMPHDVIEFTRIDRPPQGRETPAQQIARLLEAHELVIRDARRVAEKASEQGDEGTNDLLISDVVRVNEMQVWFLSEHLVDVESA